MSADDRGFLLGEGLFETIHVVHGVPQHLAEHLARMERSATALGLPAWPDLGPTVWRLFEAEHEAYGEPVRAALRVTLSAGSGRGLVPREPPAPRLRADLVPLPNPPERSPLAAVTVRSHRVDPSAAIAGHKVLSWMPWILARKEALDRGADAALVTTVDGDVCEADHANLFAVVGDAVVTPALDRGVLPGITRARALAALRHARRPVEERRLEPEELATASEAWLTSSLDGVRGLSSVDGRSLPAPGPVTAWLADCVNPA